jgi:Rha family phage regulatory protein
MKQLILNPNYGLYEKNETAYCDSRQVAQAFEKEHFHILRDIADILATMDKINESKFGLVNFKPSRYLDAHKQWRPRYLLTKDGFTYLTMGYSGEKAAIFKIRYIEKFNEMRAFIDAYKTERVDFPAYTQAIKEVYDNPEGYYYALENDIIYRVVLGMNAKPYKALHGINPQHSLRPYLSQEQVAAIKRLQSVDVGLLYAGQGRDAREKTLRRYCLNNRMLLTD